MGRTQSFIRIKPANLLAGFGSTRRWKPVLPSGANSTVTDVEKSGDDNTMLKVHLKKFPNFIGHSSSRINRLYNEDAYAINIIKLPSLAQRIAIENESDLKGRFEKSNDWKRSVLKARVGLQGYLRWREVPPW